MSLYLGLDGGGTKTEAALVDDTGSVVSEARGQASNPLRSSFARAFTALDDAAARVMTATRAEGDDIRAVTAGLAGAGQPRVANRFVGFLSTRFRNAEIEALTDLEIALEAIAESGPAMVLVAGTGSAVFGRNAEGRTARAGGWGPWFSDEGSAYDIGRRTLALLARARDSGAPLSDLERAMGVALGIRDWEQVTERAARKPLEVLPAIFPGVAAAAEAGSDAARAVLFEAADSLTVLAGTVIGRLGLERSDFAIGLMGGVFGCASCLDRHVQESLAALAAGARLTPASYSPAVAAARRALRRAGGPFGQAAADR